MQNTKLASNGAHNSGSEGLKVIIVGGGIGGLAAALALRQQGHNVHVYESSGFSKEIGAALNVCPNANGILKRMGISCKDVGACAAEWMSEWSYTGENVRKINLVQVHKVHEHKWRLAHRVKLHDALRRAATEEAGSGVPAKLHLSMPVIGVDTANAIVSFKEGSSVQGDVVIGADGVRSITKAFLPEGNVQPFPSGLSAFRFLIPREKLLSDPVTHKFAEDDGAFNGIFAPDRSIIMYPTNDNTMMNYVCIHPDFIDGSTGSWGVNTTRSVLLEVYKEFHTDILTMLGKADESSLKVWKLLDMEALPNWHHERLAVMGDAPHPFLPFLGQGAAIAIEDAVALGVVLERGLSPDEIPDRLALYQEIRKKRAELVQHYTRLNGKARGKKTAFDAARYQIYCFGYDEWDNSNQKLREWKWARMAQKAPLMTSVFGPARSLQQIHTSQWKNTFNPTFTTASIKFNTSRPVLETLLPPGNKALKFRTLASIAQCTIRQTTFRGAPSLGGRGYNQLALYIHGIEYIDSDGVQHDGAFLPIMFENRADTIVEGREELGIPKVWSTIDVDRDDVSFHIRAGWEEFTWGNFQLDELEVVDASTPSMPENPLPDASLADQGVILHRYIAPVGSNQSESEYTPEYTWFVPLGNDITAAAAGLKLSSSDVDHKISPNGELDQSTAMPPTIQRVWRASSATFGFNDSDWDTLPTLHHIVSRLREIPIISVVEARVTEGTGTPGLAWN